MLSRMVSVKAKRPEVNLQTSAGLEKALNEQEKLRREVHAMEKTVGRFERLVTGVSINFKQTKN